MYVREMAEGEPVLYRIEFATKHSSLERACSNNRTGSISSIIFK